MYRYRIFARLPQMPLNEPCDGWLQTFQMEDWNRAILFAALIPQIPQNRDDHHCHHYKNNPKSPHPYLRRFRCSSFSFSSIRTFISHSLNLASFLFVKVQSSTPPLNRSWIPSGHKPRINWTEPSYPRLKCTHEPLLFIREEELISLRKRGQPYV